MEILMKGMILFYTVSDYTWRVYAASVCTGGLCTGIMNRPYAKSIRSKRKLGGALLCLPCAALRGFCVSSGDT
jgi:hypothetical protein